MSDRARLIAEETLLCDATEIVAARMAILGWDHALLAERCGKSTGWVRRRMSGKLDPTLRDLARMGRAMGITFKLDSEEIS